MQVIAVYSESGGVSKTTTAVSLAMAAAKAGERAVIIDLDPRAAATRWMDAAPTSEGLDVGAILADEDPTGWAQDMAVQSPWSPNLRMIPSSRNVSVREGEQADFVELRLKSSLDGLEADVVVIDCPNRQGGPLILSALTAADTVVYAAKPDEDGVNGVEGARTSVERFRRSRRVLGIDNPISEAGIIVGAFRGTAVPRRIEQYAIDQFDATGLLLYPLVPDRSIVQDVRATHDWYGDYRKGAPVVDVYDELYRKVKK